MRLRVRLRLEKREARYAHPPVKRAHEGKAHVDHERLNVCQESVQFVAWSGALGDGIERRACTKDHLSRASVSVPTVLAQGNSKFSPVDRARFFDVAYGSALERAACLDVLLVSRDITASQSDADKLQLVSIVFITNWAQTNE